jgi:hypothetical protein
VLVRVDITSGVLAGEGTCVGDRLAVGVLVLVGVGVAVFVGAGVGLAVAVSVSLGWGWAACTVGRGGRVAEGEGDAEGLVTAATGTWCIAGGLAAAIGLTPWLTSRLVTVIRARIMATDDTLAILRSCRWRAWCSCCRNAPDIRGLFSLPDRLGSPCYPLGASLTGDHCRSEHVTCQVELPLVKFPLFATPNLRGVSIGDSFTRVLFSSRCQWSYLPSIRVIYRPAYACCSAGMSSFVICSMASLTRFAFS